MNVESLLTFIGSLIIIGVISEAIFRRYDVPDVIFLMLTGLIFGPITHLIQTSLKSTFISVFSAIALMIILFEGGLNLNIKEVIANTPKSAKLSFLNFILTLLFTTFFFYLLSLFNILVLDLKTVLLISSILGGTSGIVVIPLLKKINIDEKLKNILSLESTFTDAITIVVTISLALYFTTETSKLSDLIKNLISNLSVAIVIGLVFGLMWLTLLNKILYIEEARKYRYLLTLAIIFYLYSFVQIVGGSSAIAAFIFGLVLGNVNPFKEAFNLDIKKKVVNYDIYFINEQFSFLVKVFFFFLIGLLIPFSLKELMIALLFTILIIIARYVSILVLFKELDKNTKLFISFFTPKGLAAAVLAIYLSQLQLKDSALIPNIVFLVVLISILLSSLSSYFCLKSSKKEQLKKKEDEKKEKQKN
jgi:cell volume regulation protein A